MRWPGKIGMVGPEQNLKPETLEGLKQVPTGHQVQSLVRIAPKDVDYWLKYPKRVLWLKGDRAYWVTKAQSSGKHFVLMK